MQDQHNAKESNMLCIILAAGVGKRMHSQTPKVLHKLCGETMIEHVLRAVREGVDAKSVVVIGRGGQEVQDLLGSHVEYALQTEQLGTGHAVIVTREHLSAQSDGYTLVVAGDMPLLKAQTLRALADETIGSRRSATLLSAIVPDPRGFGRIVRAENGGVAAIIEESDANEEQKKIAEVNASAYCFYTPALLEALDNLKPNNAQGEYYLTDCIAYLAQKGEQIGVLTSGADEFLGVNDRLQLAAAEKALRLRINQGHLLRGVAIVDVENCYIDAKAEIESGVVIYPGNVIEGNTRIGTDTILYPGNFIESAQIGKNNKIGPNAHLRPKTKTGDGCRVGNFVELKNVSLDDGAKVSHLAYCGDGEIGKKANISCGVIFSNYDGVNKFRTTVGDNAFIGCNANLVAPVTVGEGAYVAAGSTITDDVPDDDLGIARQRQSNKAGWAKKRREAYHKQEE